MPVAAAVTAVVVGTGYSVERGQSAAREQKRSSKRQAEANRVGAAQKENERQGAIRQQVRQERVRRAQVVSAAEASGVSGSSVEASTIGSGQTLAQSGQAFATGATLSNNLQSDYLQKAADANARANFDLAQGSIGSAVSNLTVSAFTIGNS